MTQKVSFYPCHHGLLSTCSFGSTGVSRPLRGGVTIRGTWWYLLPTGPSILGPRPSGTKDQELVNDIHGGTRVSTLRNSESKEWTFIIIITVDQIVQNVTGLVPIDRELPSSTRPSP